MCPLVSPTWSVAAKPLSSLRAAGLGTGPFGPRGCGVADPLRTHGRRSCTSTICLPPRRNDRWSGKGASACYRSVRTAPKKEGTLTDTGPAATASRLTTTLGGTTAALLVASLTWVLALGPARAEYPDRLIRLVVPQAAGSATDVLARILAAELEPQIGQSIVVEDRPGGALTIGLAFTAKSEPDGYTIAMGPIGALAITRHLVKKLPYDIERDFQPIALVTHGQMLLAVSPELPVRSVAELIALAKAKPGSMVYASSSAGSPGHVGFELLKSM